MSAALRDLALPDGPRRAAAGRALSDREMAIARSVLFAALFEYPLTLAQLRQTLIESEQTPSEILATFDASEALASVVAFRDGFFFPKGCAHFVDERRRREARSRSFLADHRFLLKLICAIPYVRMVALSGSIAHLNLDGAGDLDLFVVTRGRHVWSVTVAVVLLAKLMRRRRIVCANFTIADSRLALDQRDLFTASQIIHLKPLIGRDVYRRFLAANPFVFRFYPNFHEAAPETLGFEQGRSLGWLKAAVEDVCAPVARLVEAGCRRAYRAYLARRASSWQSPEQVRLQADCLKLHTQSHRQSVLDRFDRSVQSLRCGDHS
jgi:hypothetical protein